LEKERVPAYLQTEDRERKVELVDKNRKKRKEKKEEETRRVKLT